MAETMKCYLHEFKSRGGRNRNCFVTGYVKVLPVDDLNGYNNAIRKPLQRQQAFVSTFDVSYARGAGGCHGVARLGREAAHNSWVARKLFDAARIYCRRIS